MSDYSHYMSVIQHVSYTWCPLFIYCIESKFLVRGLRIYYKNIEKNVVIPVVIVFVYGEWFVVGSNT